MNRQNNLLCNLVAVKADESWYSQQLELSYPNSGIGFEVRVRPLQVSSEGAFYVRAGAEQRQEIDSYVGVTADENVYLDGVHLPDLNLDQDDMPDVSAAPFEQFINVGNVNARFVELEFRVTAGSFELSVRACEKRG